MSPVEMKELQGLVEGFLRDKGHVPEYVDGVEHSDNEVDRNAVMHYECHCEEDDGRRVIIQLHQV